MTTATGAMCATHPASLAIGTCTRCGTFVCNVCGEYAATDNQLYCQRCLGQLESPLASIGQRFMAQLVDGVVLMLGVMPAAAAAVVLVAGFARTDVETVTLVSVGTLLAAAAFFFFAGLVAQLWAHVRWQQTLGKRMSGIRVVLMSGDTPSIWRLLFLRNLIPIVFSQVTGGIFGLADYLFAFRSDRRRIADHLSETRVVVDTRARDAG